MPAALRFSAWLYGVLLRLYPRRFRAACAAPMRLTFHDACRAAYQQRGARGLLAVWLPTLLDLLPSALAEHFHRGDLSMPPSRLITLAGPLTVVVGVLWLIPAAGDLTYQLGLSQSEAFLGLWLLPFLLSFVPLLFALLGLRLRFYPAAGALGKFGLTLSVAGCAAAILAVLTSLLLGSAAPEAAPSLWINYAAVLGLLSLRLGLLLFGLEALRVRPWPRLNLLALLVGATVVLSLPLDWFGVPAFLPLPWASAFLHFALSGAAWVLLGLALLDQRAPRPVVAQ